MRQILILILAFSLCGCSTVPAKSGAADNACLGSADLPPEFAGFFKPAEDEVLLTSAKGAQNTGALCQGQVYANNDLNPTLYRVWNSTNPTSRMGHWWAFYRPEGKVAQFRADYEVCYEWSPLDKLTICKLNAGAKVVVGTGQSAFCSKYVTYPTSAAKQVYIGNSSASLSDCSDYDLLFDWSRVSQ